ncbi:MAG: hypothetical protein ACOVO3_06515, partial [Fluviicola sp.]
ILPYELDSLRKWPQLARTIYLPRGKKLISFLILFGDSKIIGIAPSTGGGVSTALDVLVFFVEVLVADLGGILWLFLNNKSIYSTNVQ